MTETPRDDDRFPGESAPPGESEAIAAIVASISAEVRDAARTGPARRDAHTKAHGCVRAEFEVAPDLPPALAVGLFAKPRTFSAWIRFSNGAGAPQPDSVGDGRGMAVKVLGVEGSPSTTQDFVMIDNPVFFVRNVRDYAELQATGNLPKFFFPSLNPFRFRLHEFFIAMGMSRKTVSNPLNLRYWSMAPIRFGEAACKYSARPALTLSGFTDRRSGAFMRENMIQHLRINGMVFDFLVQVRARPEAMPIEDPTIEWKEADAPFVKVATIMIPAQDFANPERDAFSENLSFTPWHCLDAHRPLGGMNRVRRAVYDEISKLRHALNGAARVEPAP